MIPLQTANHIQLILKTKFNVNSLIKGSYRYGIPSDISDIDIQLDINNPNILNDLKDYFHAKVLDPVNIIDNEDNVFTSYMLVFKENNIEISLLYDDNPKVYELVSKVLNIISDLPIEQKYILRLTGGSYKYMGLNAYKTILEIFDKISPILKTGLVDDIKSGKLIDKADAQIIRKMVQALFVNETNCKYPRKFLI